MNEYLLLILSWVVYLGLHSVLAMTSIKSKFRARPYRIFYTIFSSVGLLGLLFLNGSIKSASFFESKGAIRYLSLMLTTFGVMAIQVSFREYSLKGFVGFAEEKQELKTTGVLGHVRHPIISGIILIVIGFFLFIPNVPTLVSVLCMLIYLPIGVALEEKKLVNTFGDAYREYRKRVPAIIPTFRKK